MDYVSINQQQIESKLKKNQTIFRNIKNTKNSGMKLDKVL